MAASDWRSFWDGEHSIYVNAHHKDVHYREIADQIAAYVPGRRRACSITAAARPCTPTAWLRSQRSAGCANPRPAVRAAMAARFAGNPRIKMCAPEDLEARPDRSLDLIVANSVVQYLTAPELERLLAVWRRLLAPGGSLIVGRHHPAGRGRDQLMSAALLRYATRNGFLLAALAGLVRTAVSPYRKLRSQLGIAQYTEAEFMQRLRAAGYKAERLARNMEHNPSRMTFRAQLLQ